MKKLKPIHHQILIQNIKKHIMPHENVADRIAKILDIQPEEAYRRLRGDTPFSLTEVFLLGYNQLSLYSCSSTCPSKTMGFS